MPGVGRFAPRPCTPHPLTPIGGGRVRQAIRLAGGGGGAYGFQKRLGTHCPSGDAAVHSRPSLAGRALFGEQHVD
eukprot:scaffold7161_cov109-Isochrysis_galbana.AAC.2